MKEVADFREKSFWEVPLSKLNLVLPYSDSQKNQLFRKFFCGRVYVDDYKGGCQDNGASETKSTMDLGFSTFCFYVHQDLQKEACVSPASTPCLQHRPFWEGTDTQSDEKCS